MSWVRIALLSAQHAAAGRGQAMTQDNSQVFQALHAQAESTVGPAAGGNGQAVNPWGGLADVLADWTLSRIVVRKDVYGITSHVGKRFTGHDILTKDLLIQHYQGLENIGAHLISPENSCKCLIADVDAHDDSADPEINWQCVNLIVDTLGQFDLHPLVCDSNGKGGYHVREFFKKPVASQVAYWLGQQIRARLKAAGLPDVEVFPKQDDVTIQTPYGSWVRLPGKHHKRDHYTRVYDPKTGLWPEGEAAIRALVRVAGDAPKKLLDGFNAQLPAKPARTTQAAADGGERPDEAKVREALDIYRNNNVSQDEWIGVGMALNDWNAQAGLAVWIDWSAQSSKHHPGNHTCEDRWQRFYPGGGLTIATIFKRAMELGWKPSTRAKPASNGKVAQTGNKPNAPGGKRPEILITTREHEVTDQAVAAIAADGNLFQRGGALVAILEDCKPQPKRTDIKRPPGSLRISVLPHAQIRRLMTVHADWLKVKAVRGKDEIVPAHPPAWGVEGVATLGTWEGIRPLEGIVEAPTLRPDGSLIDQPGYDPDTGLWFVPSGDFPAVPGEPTVAQAVAARDKLYYCVEDFPFAGAEHKAAWLASYLTALARFAIDGPCPLFLFDANCPGTGKSKLCDIIAILATSREMARGAYPDEQSEMEKMLLSVAIAGDRFVLFDNVTSGFSVGGSAIDRALTARTMKGRILGRSEMTPELPVNVVFYATGNNLGVRGDALRRIVPCRLESTMERPEERTAFKIQGDLLAYVKEHRGELVAAGLTILRAYIVAGRPDQYLTPMDYPAWCELIRNAVNWIAGRDPCESRKELIANDEETAERKALIEGWEALCRLNAVSFLTVAEAREGVEKHATQANPEVMALREFFMNWSRDGKLPSAKAVGKRIAKYRDRNCGGKRFRRTGNDPITWAVQAIK